MARTHKTALIKQQMAAEAAAREAANAAAAADSADGKAASVKAAHREAVHSARTRSEKADAIQRARNGCVETEAEEDTELEEKPAATSVVIDTSEASEGGEEHEEESTGAEDDGADAELESDGGSSSSAGRKRKQRPTLHVDEDMATVPPFTERHRSWAEFTQAFDVYKAATNQVLVVKEVINVARRNKSLRNQVQYQGLPDDEIPLVPTTLDPYQRKYIYCPFQLIAQWTESADESWVIVPKRAVYTHNHQVSTGIYQQYPGIRQEQAGPSSIYEYIRENSDHHVTMQDVRNLVARLRNSGAELSDDDAVAERIVNFNVESPMNVSSVHESARGNTGVISITTGHMRAMVESFPEVLQMDCTHKTNK
ncbi:hypothetical protein F444_13671 [Phytophthora nicotianae P1976]|uniref:ZSWIM1/3 RNaseH-like domain-containing protein n=1 Tax=Phytophthora nicotianae P1976 TaxID=1317066 RepID=A0A080ZT44_PHYNI|nr:hypothetical protein F444_13671 [Phytophthora nicotianae P1976]